MMQGIMLVQAMMQVMGDGGVRDTCFENSGEENIYCFRVNN
jgi:hypothetical protein